VSVSENTKSQALGNFTELYLFSVLRTTWAAISPRPQTTPNAQSGLPERDFGKRESVEELHGLVDALAVTRRRILTNAFLNAWMTWCAWIFVGLLLAGAFIPKLLGAVILAAILIVIGFVIMLVGTWRSRLSIYDAACRLDSAAGLHDRLSTALYFGTIPHPEGMLQCQRQDAAKRLKDLNPQGLFPFEMPAAAGRAAILLLLVAGLFVYRMYHKPPMVALLQSAARSQLVQSILTPLVHAMEKDVQRTMAVLGLKADVQQGDVRPGEQTAAADDLWQPNDDKGADAENEQDKMQEANLEQQDSDQNEPMPDGMAGAKPGESMPQEDAGQQSQPENNDSERGNKDSQQSENGNQSSNQSLLQSLKNMMSNSQGRPMNDRANQQPPNGQEMPRSGDSHQAGATDGSKKGDSKGSSDGKQKASQTSSSGAGSQQGDKEMRKDQTALSVTGVPDRVALESNGFKEDTRVRIDAGTGTAKMAVRNVAPNSVAVIDGAEQENIPARYRLYVQHYFEHADSNAQK
jgi:hypothetical protein